MDANTLATDEGSALEDPFLYMAQMQSQSEFMRVDLEDAQAPAAPHRERFPLQYQTLFAPLHALQSSHNHTYRHLTKQLQICLKALTQLLKKPTGSLTEQQMQKNRTVLEKKISDMMEKLRKWETDRNDALRLLSKREHYLRCAPEHRFRDDSVWKLLLDYCAREGCTETVHAILRHLHPSPISLRLQTTTTKNTKKTQHTSTHKIPFTDLLSLHVYESELKIIQSLKKQKCKLALQWCDQNRSLLKKISSPLEFELKLQEFIELVRNDEPIKAIEYAKSHLKDALTGANGAQIQPPSNILKIKQAMGSIAFGPHTSIQPYAALFASSRWDLLIDSFKKSNRMIHSLTTHPELLVHLQAGISALKSPPSYDTVNINDPLQNPALKSLAENLPYAFHDQSILRCALSGDVMNDLNPPMALPNGNVYGLKALQDMSEKNGGFVQDPRTMETFAFGDLKKCYIMN